MYANALGRAARGLWNDIPKHRPYVRLGSFVVMPNHVHGIVKIVLHDQNRRSPERDGKIHPCSLSAIIGGFKSAVSRTCAFNPVWQRNFYDRVIRNRDELVAATRYIDANPETWQFDFLNPKKAAGEASLAPTWDCLRVN
jgi:putative transposase